MKLRFTRRATADIRSVYDYLALESPLARTRFEQRLAEILRDIREYPMGGRDTDEAHVRIRNTHPYPYLVFYQVRERDILILNVRHGARHPRSMPARPR